MNYVRIWWKCICTFVLFYAFRLLQLINVLNLVFRHEKIVSTSVICKFIALFTAHLDAVNSWLCVSAPANECVKSAYSFPNGMAHSVRFGSVQLSSVAIRILTGYLCTALINSLALSSRMRTGAQTNLAMGVQEDGVSVCGGVFSKYIYTFSFRGDFFCSCVCALVAALTGPP